MSKEYSELINLAKDTFPPEVIERAQGLLAEIGSIGALHSHSQGVSFIRKPVAKFIGGMKAQNLTQGVAGSTPERDGSPSIPNHILQTAGALPSVFLFVQMLIESITSNNPDPSGVLISIP